MKNSPKDGCVYDKGCEQDRLGNVCKKRIYQPKFVVRTANEESASFVRKRDNDHLIKWDGSSLECSEMPLDT